MNRRGALAALATATGVAQAAPGLLSIGPVRRLVAPTLAGRTRPGRVALTFDDGPDPRSTPRFLDLLDRFEVRATFFLLGEHLQANADLVGDLADRGHELAVHGWTHTCTAVVGPARLADELRRTSEALSDLSGRPVRWYRPPYGVLTLHTLGAARAAGLDVRLWTAWGRDWDRRATPGSVHRRVTRGLGYDGGTVLLHDTDRTSAPGSWRTTLAATERLLGDWRDRGVSVGPLGGLSPLTGPLGPTGGPDPVAALP